VCSQYNLALTRCPGPRPQGELRKLIANLKRWTAPERVGAISIFTFPSQQWIEKEPYGVVLVVGPFNYPFQLTVSVVAGAVAAGNNVILKPSNDVPASSRLLADLFQRYVDPSVVSVVGPAIPGDGVDVMKAGPGEPCSPRHHRSRMGARAVPWCLLVHAKASLSHRSRIQHMCIE
jgi:hypothetical protein